MKRSYARPVIVIENIKLTRTVPGCAWDIGNLQTHEVCGAVGDLEDFNMPDVVIFNQEPCHLSLDDVEDVTGASFCYITSSESWTFFNS
jgi:hypothetical protein